MSESVRPVPMPADRAALPTVPPPLRLIGSAVQSSVSERYTLLEPLGEGGMAIVHKAKDLASGALIALKRLRAPDDKNRADKARLLFEREYHVLSQLAHPRVVRVYDYGVDVDGPYYTMELLDGGDLHGLAPVPWRTACSLVRDACSVLSLLHSRRLIHRDLSPRNIRCTSDGQAKLLDFGAMAPMGPTKQVVGTPPICAPEVLNLEPLDARADLYSLGATLYHALVGRHAYPARDFRHLHVVWTQTPLPPSALVEDVPPALDALVMSMLSLDPAARPASAAEVFDKISAIAELPVDEQLRVSSAYLHSPVLVGRESTVDRVKKKLVRVREKRGSSTLIHGASGTGRSRVISACMLEAKLLGFTVLRAHASDGQRGDYGAVRALATQLLDDLPELALESAASRVGLLAYAVPELLARVPGAALQTFDDPQQQRPSVQRALHEWFLDVASQRPLAIGVDDVDLIDEPSSAFVALLTDGIAKRTLGVVATAQTSSMNASFGALKVLKDASTRLEISELDAEEIGELVRSLFGEVPHAQTLTHKLFAASKGNPRDAMELAQHLVDRGAIRYASGTWSLPWQIDESDLPSTIAQAHQARIDGLRAEPRALALAMALGPRTGVTFDEAQILTGHRNAARLLRCLDELLVAGIENASAQRFGFAQRAFASLVRAGMPSDLNDPAYRDAHLRLVELSEVRGDTFRVAEHLLCAGEIERGLDVLVEHARASQELTGTNPEAYIQELQLLPEDWFEIYRHGIDLCRQHGRPKAHVHTIFSRMSGLIPTGRRSTEPVEQIVAQLSHDTGLDLYASLDSGDGVQMEPLARLTKSFELTQARYAATPENERVFDVMSALRPLARSCIVAIGSVSGRLDLTLWEKLPSLKPLEPLSPAFTVVDMLVQGNGKRITARTEQAREIYGALLERATQPDRAGLDETHQRYTVKGVMCGLGLIEAPMGLDIALERARAIESDPLHKVNAVLITMLHHLWQGEVRAAEKCKQQVELLHIQNSGRQWFEGGHLMGELTAHAACDDLVRVKQMLDTVAVMAEHLPSWATILCYARCEYHRIRGDHEAALKEIGLALASTAAGRHQLWCEMAGAHVKVLGALGRNEEAREHGTRYLAEAASAGLGYSVCHIEMPLAAAHAALLDREAAERLALSVIERFEKLGAKGLIVGLAFETRALVAFRLGDREIFESFAAKCGAIFRAGGNRSLVAKHERLMRPSRDAQAVAPGTGPAALLTAQAAGTHMTAALSACPGPRERARLGLDLLVARSGAQGGFLFAIEPSGPVIVAQVGLDEPPSGLTLAVAEHLRADVDDKTTTASDFELDSASTKKAVLSSLELFAKIAADGRKLHPTMIAHRSKRRYEVTGLAVLVVDSKKPFVDPADVAAHLSRAWFDSGEVTSITAWLSAFSTD